MHSYSLILLWLLISYCSAASSTDVERLFEKKIYPINPMILPVKNQSDVVAVEFKVHIGAIIDFDELIQKISVTMWLEVYWTDEQITWNETEYGGVKKISPHPDDVWRPNLAISNSFSGTRTIANEFVMLIAESSGKVTWSPGSMIETFCKVDIELYPFDTQECEFDFFNWGTVSGELSLTTFDEGMVLDSYTPNGEWNLIGFSARDYVKSYSNGTIVKPHSVITIIIKRRASVIVLTVLLPVLLLAFLNIFTFLIPAESGEKLSFGVTILLSLAVLLSYINSMMPQTSESISYLSLYISVQLIISSLIVVFSCISLSIYHRVQPEERKGRFYRCFAPKDEEKVNVYQYISRRFDTICFNVCVMSTILSAILFSVAISGIF